MCLHQYNANLCEIVTWKMIVTLTVESYSKKSEGSSAISNYMYITSLKDSNCHIHKVTSCYE